MPLDLGKKKGSVEVRTHVFQVDGAADLLDAPTAAELTRDNQFVLDGDEQASVLVADDPQSELLVRVARTMAGLSSKLYRLSEDWTMPASVETLRAWDHLVIASDRFLDDPQGVVTVRGWLQQGGRVWVMLDKTGPETLAALLGDAWTGAVLDEVTIVDYQLRDVRPVAGRRDGERQHLADPVRLLHVHPGAGDVEYVVDQWPAAVTYRVGRGTVLVTTFGGSGWYAGLAPELLEGLADPRIAQSVVKQSTRKPLSVLARSFFGTFPAPPVSLARLRAAAALKVGYQAPPRWLVATILGTLCSGLLLSGVVLHRKKKWAGNLLVAPLAAMLATVVMTAVGRATRTGTPPTLATAEVVSASPATDEFCSYVGLALFRPAASAERIAGRGALCQFDFVGQEGQVQRVFWTDVGQWQLEQAEIPPGLSMAQATRHGFLRGEYAARATLGPAGLVGRVELPVEIATNTATVMTGWGPALSAEIGPDGSFRAGAADTLPPDRYVRAALLDDATLRRQDLIRQLVSNQRRAPLFSSPTLLLWSEAWDTGLTLEASQRREGEALVMAPLHLSRPPAGSTVQIPAPMIPFRSVAGPDGSAPTSAYSNSERRWVDDLSRETRISLRFQLPTFILPVKLKSVNLAAEIHAPGRTIEWFGWHGSDPHSLAQSDSPLRQSLSVPIDDVQSLQLDDRGGVVFTIDVGRHPDEVTGGLAAAQWQISNVFLTAEASVPRE